MKEYLFDKAKQYGKTIVFPEAEYSERVYTACKYLVENGICKVIVIGKKNSFKDNFIVYDPNTFEHKEELIELLLEKRKSKGLTEEQAEKMYQNYIYFSTLLVESGYADGMVCGAETSTANTIRPALQIIKAKQGIRLVSSCFILYKKGMPFGEQDKVCLADCGLNIEPTSEDLCDIAIASANTLKSLFGLDSRVAFLSFSSNGSGGDNDSVNKVKNAVALMKDLKPNFEYDGEMQFDCAVSAKVSALKFPNSKVAGKANVFIFPDINAGNIGYKIMQFSGEMMAIGPIIQGLNKPVNDVSRGANAMEIAVIAAVTVLQSVENNNKNTKE